MDNSTTNHTIFSQIIEGTIACHKIYEDNHVLSFLDVNPISHGHTLVIPKEAAATMDKLSQESAAALGACLPKICRAILAATQTTAYNILQNNGTAAHQAVFHVHIHIIPRYDDHGLGIGWNPRALSSQQGTTLSEAIANHL